MGRLRGFAFDLDGTIWAGPTLLPGAGELVEGLRSEGLAVVFATNSSRHGARILADRLTAMGVRAGERDVLAAFDLVAEEITRRLGRVRVMALATPDMDELLAAAGHEVVGVDDWPRAQAVVVGNDPAFDFGRLRAASRAVAAGAAFFAVNMDPRYPVAADTFDPGCGALAEAVATAAEVRPIVIGKPFAPLFERTLERLGCSAGEAAMVGDSLGSDVDGARAMGMFTVWIDGRGEADRGDAARADMVARNLPELHRIWQNQRKISGMTPQPAQ
ncbi:HAD-IIA family hydrolase [Aquisphaera giovannonii]|uniref:HAD-IIA family hydrolase n=1 Tax=Aquisphaera giovannonii TaxID=406548 RepID=UPI00143D2BE9|nr:HAD-IIA family hydrolase [Aquisphaera giovannonii]